jgi:hypothetical protein
MVATRSQNTPVSCIKFQYSGAEKRGATDLDTGLPVELFCDLDVVETIRLFARFPQAYVGRTERYRHAVCSGVQVT